MGPTKDSPAAPQPPTAAEAEAIRRMLDTLDNL
jgi:hypothetical protein